MARKSPQSIGELAASLLASARGEFLALARSRWIADRNKSRHAEIGEVRSLSLTAGLSQTSRGVLPDPIALDPSGGAREWLAVYRALAHDGALAIWKARCKSSARLAEISANVARTDAFEAGPFEAEVGELRPLALEFLRLNESMPNGIFALAAFDAGQDVVLPEDLVLVAPLRSAWENVEARARRLVDTWSFRLRVLEGWRLDLLEQNLGSEPSRSDAYAGTPASLPDSATPQAPTRQDDPQSATFEYLLTTVAAALAEERARLIDAAALSVRTNLMQHPVEYARPAQSDLTEQPSLVLRRLDPSDRAAQEVLGVGDERLNHAVVINDNFRLPIQLSEGDRASRLATAFEELCHSGLSGSPPAFEPPAREAMSERASEPRADLLSSPRAKELLREDASGNRAQKVPKSPSEMPAWLMPLWAFGQAIRFPQRVVGIAFGFFAMFALIGLGNLARKGVSDAVSSTEQPIDPWIHLMAAVNLTSFAAVLIAALVFLVRWCRPQTRGAAAPTDLRILLTMAAVFGLSTIAGITRGLWSWPWFEPQVLVAGSGTAVQLKGGAFARSVPNMGGEVCAVNYDAYERRDKEADSIERVKLKDGAYTWDTETKSFKYEDDPSLRLRLFVRTPNDVVIVGTPGDGDTVQTDSLGGKSFNRTWSKAKANCPTTEPFPVAGATTPAYSQSGPTEGVMAGAGESFLFLRQSEGTGPATGIHFKEVTRLDQLKGLGFHGLNLYMFLGMCGLLALLLLGVHIAVYSRVDDRNHRVRQLALSAVEKCLAQDRAHFRRQLEERLSQARALRARADQLTRKRRERLDQSAVSRRRERLLATKDKLAPARSALQHRTNTTAEIQAAIDALRSQA